LPRPIDVQLIDHLHDTGDMAGKCGEKLAAMKAGDGSFQGHDPQTSFDDHARVTSQSLLLNEQRHAAFQIAVGRIDKGLAHRKYSFGKNGLAVDATHSVSNNTFAWLGSRIDGDLVIDEGS
jgi:hypothetical protein